MLCGAFGSLKLELFLNFHILEYIYILYKGKCNASTKLACFWYPVSKQWEQFPSLGINSGFGVKYFRILFVVFSHFRIFALLYFRILLDPFSLRNVGGSTHVSVCAWNNAWRVTWGLPPPVKLESRHITFGAT